MVSYKLHWQVELYAMKTFHEIVDQIYYKVDHLEPWATGSRKTAGRSKCLCLC